MPVLHEVTITAVHRVSVVAPDDMAPADVTKLVERRAVYNDLPTTETTEIVEVERLTLAEAAEGPRGRWYVNDGHTAIVEDEETAWIEGALGTLHAPRG